MITRMYLTMWLLLLGGVLSRVIRGVAYDKELHTVDGWLMRSFIVWTVAGLLYSIWIL